jgi:hypothetical protein
LEIYFYDHYICQKLEVMIIESLISFTLFKGLLLLLPGHQLNDDGGSDWLNNDGFKDEHYKDETKKYLFNELDRLKKRFIQDINEKGVIVDAEGKPLSPMQIYNLIEGHKIRIDKVRLMIRGEVLIAEHHHKPSDTYYVVARAYWMDENGKKFRKFSKNLGSKESAMVNEQIPDSKLKEIKKELEGMMWKHYQEEYKGV